MMALKSIHRTIKASAALAALAFSLGIQAPATAQIARIDRVPDDSVAVLSVPDAAEFWTKFSNLPIARTLRQYLDGPQMQQNLDYQQFLLELAKLEEELGFPATLEEFFGNIISDGTFYLRAPEPDQDEPIIGFTFGVKDEAKAARLLEVAIDRFSKSSEGENVSSVTIAGIEATRLLPGGEPTDNDPFVALKDGVLYAASSQPEFEALVSGQREGSLAALADLNTLKSLIPFDSADFVAWVNAETIVEQLDEDGSLSAVNPALANAGKAMVTGRIGADNIAAKYASTGDPAKMSAAITPGDLTGLAYVGQTPILASVSRAFDVKVLYDQVLTALNDPTISSGIGADPIKAAEEALGISFENDLIPALGNELLFAVNTANINMANPMFSSADIVVGLRVRDTAAMRGVMQKIEQLITRQMMGEAAAADPSISGFTASTHQGVEVKTIALLPMLSPSYAVTEDYLLIGLTPISVTGALDRRAGGQSIASSAIFSEMKKLAGDHPLYDFGLFDFARLNIVIQPLLAMNEGDANMQLVTTLLRQLRHASWVQYQQDGNVVGDAILQMQN